ncbi:MAG: SHD1 domain-containing protein [Planctomycetota bacterium]
MRWTMMLAAAAVMTLTIVQVTQAQTLEYRWQSGQKFSYEIEIVIDTDAEKITYKGMTHYSVGSVSGNQAVVTYRGGLRESKQSKARRSRGIPFGGPFGAMSRPLSPFSRPTFAGRSQTTNKITLSTLGEVLAMEGDSQLPYLLGNVSLLPFEPLPERQQSAWSYDTGISITEENEDSSPFGPFGPRGRFGPYSQTTPQNVQAAGEGGTYKTIRTEDKLVSISKTYSLDTPKTDDNNVFKMRGTGTWTFDTQDNVPHAYDMKLTLAVESGNTTTTIPISVKYTRISADRLAQMEAEAKRKAEEAARLAAEKRAMAETPLTAEEKSQALAALVGTNIPSKLETLNQLAEKSLLDTDPEIADAILPWVKSTDKRIATAADKALRKWSSDYANQKKLEKAYQGPSPVDSTERYVESTTPLFIGQLVQAQRPRYGSFWRPARVKELLSDSSVKLAFLTWGKENDRDIVTVPRRNIQLAPPELEQPAAPAGNNRTSAAVTNEPAGPEVRTWSDSSGRFKIEASFVEMVDGKVRLKRADGKFLTPLPLEKLSKDDQEYVKQQQLGNPFQIE